MSTPEQIMGDLITLAHGNGGRRMRELIDAVFVRHFGGLDAGVDAATFELSGGLWASSVDGFIVQPLEFPGGNLGTLAVHGTVNDLAVSGAEPKVLTLGVVLEEGLSVETLERLVSGCARAAKACGVRIVAGDTKVAPRGHGGGAYFTSSGLGAVQRRGLGISQTRVGDVVIVSGPVGDHGAAVMLAREQFDLRGDLESDCGSVLDLCRAAWPNPHVRFLRDPTRGGFATVAHELAVGANVTVRLKEEAIPIRPPVTSICEMLGYDPLFLACEGRAVAVVGEEGAEELLAAWRGLPEGRDAMSVGRVEAPGAARVILATELGGERIIDELEDDPLPRIC